LPDQTDHPTPGHDVVVVRAAFVPEGADPPPELAADFTPIRIPAKLNPETGEITCDGVGTNFHGDLSAQWHPDEAQNQPDEEQDSGKKPGSQQNRGKSPA
jgi:hypothetical protein